MDFVSGGIYKLQPSPKLIKCCNKHRKIACHIALVSFEVFKRPPQPLKAGIVATAVFRRFLEFSMYSQRCISNGSVAPALPAICSVLLLHPTCPPVPLLNLKSQTTDRAREGRP